MRLQVDVSPAEINVRGPVWRVVIPGPELEEVRVEGKGGSWTTPCFVMVRSSTKSARFGGHNMGRAEGEYLAAR